MKEYLHLFTDVNEVLPEVNNFGISIWLPIFQLGRYYDMARLDNGVWVNQRNEQIEYVTHWLDLSKLTTKEFTKELIEECIDTISDYVCEWRDSSHEHKINALKEVFKKV